MKLTLKKYLLYSKSLAPSLSGELSRSGRVLIEELGALRRTTMLAEYAAYKIVRAMNKSRVTLLPVG